MAMKKLVGCQRKRDCKAGNAYPKVAAEPIMYWPSVLSIPFGPGPNRTMLVNPMTVRTSAGDIDGSAHQK